MEGERLRAEKKQDGCSVEHVRRQDVQKKKKKLASTKTS